MTEKVLMGALCLAGLASVITGLFAALPWQWALIPSGLLLIAVAARDL